ncbi:imidazolonepropionase-like amidohydrolase [Lewinella marina]|uniref:Amidohydrolase n=1 Tax=Neolewinella marina TaxID=438751 RepID=A0A2G0CGS0_9BACT|nr:amidohydrolase family protein [Neolewinella marina]NJB86360.1 imidazolonepropionase-like amidohydrolase [Neolewinella marina]PHK99172.1 amidohydrolase [Neolewinella marina]
MKAILTLLLFLPLWLTAQQVTYLHCGRLIDGENESVQNQKTVIITDGTITAVQDGYARPPAGANVVDLKDRTVMPGLIDLHVHIEGESNPRAYMEEFTLDPADVALRATAYCEKTLKAGFTTVRDLGGSGVNVSLRDAINRGYITGPRIYTAEKAIGTTGGHADPSNGRNRELSFDAGPEQGVINGPEEAYHAVRTRYKNGADCIKITATGGVLSVAKDGSGPQFTQEEIEAIVAAARDYGMHTAAHAHGTEGMKRAIRAGITTIEHGSLMDEEVMDLMVEHGTYYVPTLSAGTFVAEKAKVEGYFPAIIVPKALSIGQELRETFEKAYARGVKIAFGTDSGVSPHGDNAREFIYMVEAGVPPLAAIRSATVTAAEVLGRADDLGRIRPGYVADIVAVPGNPATDISTMTEVNFVMKEGKVIE